VSADRKTALITVTEPGLTYEINIDDGKVLTVIENLHDLSSRKDFSKAKIGHAALFEEFGVYYPASSGQPAEE
jgi:hypothetical protein